MKKETELNLSHFNGTDTYYEHKVLGRQMLLTEGCKYVAEEGEAYWLFDLILSYQQDKVLQEEGFQVWNLKKKPDQGWIVTCDDGNNNILKTQHIPYSDFPLSCIKFYLIDGVCMLASEY
jgi:hypothetical protein